MSSPAAVRPRWERNLVVGVALVVLGLVSFGAGVAIGMTRLSRKIDESKWTPPTPEELEAELRSGTKFQVLGLALGLVGSAFLGHHFLRRRTDEDVWRDR